MLTGARKPPRREADRSIAAHTRTPCRQRTGASPTTLYHSPSSGPLTPSSKSRERGKRPGAAGPQTSCEGCGPMRAAKAWKAAQPSPTHPDPHRGIHG